VSEGIPEITIFCNPATGYYGFSTRVPGRRMHHMIDTFNTPGEAIGWQMAHLTLAELGAAIAR